MRGMVVELTYVGIELIDFKTIFNLQNFSYASDNLRHIMRISIWNEDIQNAYHSNVRWTILSTKTEEF
jgi:hypothetical protein